MNNGTFVALVLTGGAVMGILSAITVVYASKNPSELTNVTFPTIETAVYTTTGTSAFTDDSEEECTGQNQSMNVMDISCKDKVKIPLICEIQ